MQLLSVTEAEVKAQIARPAMREIVPASEDYRVYGAAWAGEADVTRVDLSVDGGATWQAARLLGEAQRYAWRFWEYRWRTPAQSGRCKLMARATDSRGRVQPLQRDAHRGSYVINHVMPVEVEVSSKPARRALFTQLCDLSQRRRNFNFQRARYEVLSSPHFLSPSPLSARVIHYKTPQQKL